MSGAGSLLALAGAGLGLSVISSLHCAGMCGAFAVVARGSPAWHLGRALTYVALGALAGTLSGLATPAGGALAWGAAIASSLLIVAFGLKAGGFAVPGLGGRGASASLPLRGPARWLGALLRRVSEAGKADETRGRVSRGLLRLAFGAANGLMPCGLVYAGLALAAASGGVAQGAAVMAGFGLGTVPALAVTAAGSGLLARLGRSLRVRRIAAVAVIAIGLASVWTRLPTARAGDGEEGAAPTCPHHPAP